MYRWRHPPVEVGADDFMTQEQAAETLKLSMMWVPFLMQHGTLQPATLDGSPGVTRESVLNEAENRNQRWYKLRAFFRALLDNFTW